MGLLDRGGKEVRAKVVVDTKRNTLESQVRKEVKFGSTVYTDEAVSYEGLLWAIPP